MSWRFSQFQQKPAKNNDSAADRALSLGPTSFQTGASSVAAEQTDICNNLTHSSDCKALAALRCEHLSQHFLKPAEFCDISVSRIPHFVQSVVLLNV